MSDHYVRIDDTTAVCDCGEWSLFEKEPGGDRELLAAEGSRHLERHGFEAIATRDGIGPIIGVLAGRQR